MRIAMIQDDYELGLGEAPIPALPPGGALVRVLGCGLCGSDLDKAVNRKAAPGSVLGHEVVGIIDALDDEHSAGWRLGDRVAVAHHVPCRRCHYCINDGQSMCRHFKRTNLTPGGFAQYIALSAEHLAYTTFKVPVDIAADEASCIEPLACVLRAVRRSYATFGGSLANGSVAVVGLGFIGLMAAQVYQNDGLGVYGLDLDARRLRLAREQNFVTAAFHAADERQTLDELFALELPVGKADIVFLSVVTQKTLKTAFDLVRDGGVVVLFTSGQPNAAEPAAIDPNALYFREINVIASYSPSLTDLKDAAAMIFNRKIHVKSLVSHRMPLSDIREAFELYRSGRAMKVFIETGDAV